MSLRCVTRPHKMYLPTETWDWIKRLGISTSRRGKGRRISLTTPQQIPVRISPRPQHSSVRRSTGSHILPVQITQAEKPATHNKDKSSIKLPRIINTNARSISSKIDDLHVQLVEKNIDSRFRSSGFSRSTAYIELFQPIEVTNLSIFRSATSGL